MKEANLQFYNSVRQIFIYQKFSSKNEEVDRKLEDYMQCVLKSQPETNTKAWGLDKAHSRLKKQSIWQEWSFKNLFKSVAGEFYLTRYNCSQNDNLEGKKPTLMNSFRNVEVFGGSCPGISASMTSMCWYLSVQRSDSVTMVWVFASLFDHTWLP